MKNSSLFILVAVLHWVVACGSGTLDYSVGAGAIDANPGVASVSSVTNADGSQTVTVGGTGFIQECTTVEVSGTACTPVTVLSEKSLECILPSRSISPTRANTVVSNATCLYTVFVTKSRYTGDLGGLSGADAKCASAAAAGSRTSSLGTNRTWRAILSVRSETAASRISIKTNALIRLVNDVVVANKKADFWDGSLAVPINLDEDGNPAPSPTPTPSPGVVGTTDPELYKVWTGQTDYVVPAGISESYIYCSNWSSSGMQGFTGNLSATLSSWIQESQLSCASQARLYCINADP